MLKPQTILVTGADGFIGRNLCTQLENESTMTVLRYDKNTAKGLLSDYLHQCDFIFHLAGVNRPQDERVYNIENHLFTAQLLAGLIHAQNRSPIVASSSVQATNDSPYGISKKRMEQLLLAYHTETGAPVYRYRLPGVFGKWCKPHYNSVVATFCHQLAHHQPIQIDNPSQVLSLIHIDDLVAQWMNAIEHPPQIDFTGYAPLPPSVQITVGELAKIITQCSCARGTWIPEASTDFELALYQTFLTYLPSDNLSTALDAKHDLRGMFCECIKSHDFGQFSVSVTKAGNTRGGHWHQHKTEKFCVVHGNATITITPLFDGISATYHVTGDAPTVIEIPPGTLHTIKNTGEQEMILLIWCSEVFNEDDADTYCMLPQSIKTKED